MPFSQKWGGELLPFCFSLRIFWGKNSLKRFVGTPELLTKDLQLGLERRFLQRRMWENPKGGFQTGGLKPQIFGENRGEILSVGVPHYWGFKRWGFKQIRGYLRKKAFFLRYPRIFQVLFAQSGQGRKGQKKGEKGRFRPISGKGGQTPLKPPFVTPPFAAAQFWEIGPFRGWLGSFRGLSRGLFGAFSGPILLRAPPPREKRRNCPERALFGPIGAFRAKPPFAKPPFGFPWENVVGAKTAPTAISWTFAPFLRRIRAP